MSLDDAAWPAVAYEQRRWTSGLPPDALTRRQRDRVAEPYSAAVVPMIASREVRLASSIAADADEATQLLTRFDAELGTVVLPFTAILLRTESAASSEIEHLTSGARAIAEAELGERITGNAAAIVGNVRAMRAALALADEVDAASIVAMQSALLGEESALTGSWRDEQVWIGGDGLSPHRAAFVPPHHDAVPQLIADLVRFIARDDVPALAQVAIAHAQFETIHPFPDGNGRTGRAIVQAMLRRLRVTTHVTVPVSAGLLHDVDGYHSALDAYRLGDAGPIVTAFSKAAGYGVANGRGLVADITSIRAEWAARMHGLRADAAARAVADLALAHPALNAALVIAELGVAPATAFRALDELVERGVLTLSTSKRRSRVWLAQPILAALDDFAARAGRRRRPSE